MRAFSQLYESLDSTTSTLLKVAALREFFATQSPDDCAWAVYFLSGRRLIRFIGPSALFAWMREASGLPEWLVEETYSTVGDLAEAIALLMDTKRASNAQLPDSEENSTLAYWINDCLLPLRTASADEQRERVTTWWAQLDARRCFILNKLLTGALRVGVSQALVERAIAELSGLPRTVIAHRLMGQWNPDANFWAAMIAPEGSGSEVSRPYPFFLASPLEGDVTQLGDRELWLAEWKWDGIRAQIVRRNGSCFIWSRGEDLITERFPEIAGVADELPDGVVLDGEILAWTDEGVRPFGELQQRIGRKKLTSKILSATPARFLAYDLLEQNGEDLRELPIRERRERLIQLLENRPAVLSVSLPVEAGSWEELAALRQQARERGVEGLMLKRLDSPYGTGRQRGNWWKWKIEPFNFDGVLIYAQPGHGRRANLFTDYTFGVWHEGLLTPVAKAYSGLSNEEIGRLDRWIRQNTVERFGPVRSVKPEMVFELAFEAINASTRHKSGIAMRFPRIARWREDKPASQADTLSSLQALLNAPA
jgi:DNA ligase-1